jgi:hypothetical protein
MQTFLLFRQFQNGPLLQRKKKREDLRSMFNSCLSLIVSITRHCSEETKLRHLHQKVVRKLRKTRKTRTIFTQTKPVFLNPHKTLNFVFCSWWDKFDVFLELLYFVEQFQISGCIFWPYFQNPLNVLVLVIPIILSRTMMTSLYIKIIVGTLSSMSSGQLKMRAISVSQTMWISITSNKTKV